MAHAPDPIQIYHFTHLRNLPGIVADGIHSDATCRREQLTQEEIGSNDIRERRLRLSVGEVGPGGCVGDYVPWYFGPRSPMMFTLGKNNYEYQQGFDDVVYLVSSVPTVIRHGCEWLASDRNAALNLAEFIDAEQDLEEHISWDVISATYWNNFVDGGDLRAAEFLVHGSVPWEAVELVATKTAATKAKVERLICDHRQRPQSLSDPNGTSRGRRSR